MAVRMARQGSEPPILLVKWYDVTKWLLERVESFPKNQRFIFGHRIAEHQRGTPQTISVPAARTL
jgi:hypothetical protein